MSEALNPDKLNTDYPLENISVDTLKRTFEASRSPLILTDYNLPDNPIIYSNQAFLDLTGYEMAEIIGRNCRFLQGKNTDKRPAKALHDAVHAGTHARTVIKNYRKDGTEFYNDLLISPIHNDAGGITHYVGMQLDITERMQFQQKISEKSRELEDANRELEQFTYATSHDLQEPLRMITSYLQLISKRYGETLDEDGQTFLRYANEGAERMQDLIYDLLALSKISNAENRYTASAMNDIANRALENFKISLKETAANVTIGVLPTLPVDPTQMTQLFQNLIGNAIKYRRAGIAPVISITAKKGRDLYTFSVTDNGIGIKPQHFERIFVVFQRLHTRTEYTGTGIGLAIVSKIVERHGGKIWVESVPDNGSTFKFTIPISR